MYLDLLGTNNWLGTELPILYVAGPLESVVFKIDAMGEELSKGFILFLCLCCLHRNVLRIVAKRSCWRLLRLFVRLMVFSALKCSKKWKL